MSRGVNVVDAETLQVETRMFGAILQYLPNARLVHVGDNGVGTLTVPWDYYHTSSLASVGAPSISPMVRDYNYPSKYPEPFSWQLKIADFLSLNRRAFCFADMGLGKTLSAIWAADYLMRIGEVKRVLVVCPLSIMEAAWGTDLFEAFPMKTPTVLHHRDRNRRVKMAGDGCEWHIVNFDGVELILNELMYNHYDLIIVDETTQVKNERTDRWKFLSRLFRPATRGWGLSGAPTPQGPMDAYGQAKLLRPDLVTMSRHMFQLKVETKVSKFKWVPRIGHQEQVSQILQPAIRFKKEDCLTELPPVTPIYRKVELSATQRRLIDELKKKSVTEADGFQITAAHAGIVRNKYCQIVSGAVYTDDGTALAVDAKARVNEAIELIEQARANRVEGIPSGKFLLFAPYHHTIEMLMEALGSKYNVRKITSDISPAERGRIFASFQNDMDIDGIIAIPSTMAHGITATAASLTIWYAPIDKNEVYMQACNRMDRPGQKQNMVMAHMYSEPAERQLYSVLQKMGDDQESVLQWYDEFIYGV